MPAKDLTRFETLIREHRSALHPLFAYVETAAMHGSLSPESYTLFAANIAARTMLSLSEIHACCIQASLDLDPLRTAFSVMTGAEEGGFGKPDRVHTVLMMNALNYHGQVVFGLPSLDIRYLMALARLLYTSRQYRLLLEVEQSNEGIRERLQRCGLMDATELVHTCRRMATIAGIELPCDPWDDVDEIERIEQLALDSLIISKVLPETIDYCLAQLAVLGRTQAGYLQGVGFAHEGLADGMIYKMFRIMFSQVDRYASRKEFMERVYPYFGAHGNYLDVFNGVAENTDGVEVVHAQRELAKLAQLDSDSLEAAWIGANDFADRNVRIWDGILSAIETAPRPTTALGSMGAIILPTKCDGRTHDYVSTNS